MRRIVIGFSMAAGITLVSGPAAAAGCDADEIEVYRDKTKIVCRDRKEYSACIKQAGEQMSKDVHGSCARDYKDCFSQKNVDISVNAAGCLILARAGCGAGLVACAAGCNVIFTAQEWIAYHACSADITPCYEQALARDKERKERCKGL